MQISIWHIWINTHTHPVLLQNSLVLGLLRGQNRNARHHILEKLIIESVPVREVSFIPSRNKPYITRRKIRWDISWAYQLVKINIVITPLLHVLFYSSSVLIVVAYEDNYIF